MYGFGELFCRYHMSSWASAIGNYRWYSILFRPQISSSLQNTIYVFRSSLSLNKISLIHNYFNITTIIHNLSPEAQNQMQFASV
jgi:hypothetical protein